jgi:hypothetical protein
MTQKNICDIIASVQRHWADEMYAKARHCFFPNCPMGAGGRVMFPVDALSHWTAVKASTSRRWAPQ